MKKINLIIALSVVTMGVTIPASILMSNNQSVIGNKEIIDNNVNDFQSIDDNDLYASDVNDNDESKVVGDIINANSATCFAEGDTSKTANEWMGITGNKYVIFSITKDYISESDVGTVSVIDTSAKNITSSKLTIPSYIINNGNKYNVTSIGDSAFSECSKLTGDLIVPNNVTTINDSAFSECFNLATLNLNNAIHLTSIGNNSFFNCSQLNGLIIPGNMTTIGNYAFYGCFGLTGELIIPNNITSIGDGAFNGNHFVSIKLDDKNLNYCKATNLGAACDAILNITTNGIFSDKSFIVGGLACGQLEIPNTINSIGRQAFFGCSGLIGNLTIPTSVNTIDSRAFLNCAGLIGDLIIPSGVTVIGEQAFSGGPHFNSISVDSANPKYALASSKSVGTANIVIDKTLTPDLNYDYSYIVVGGLACGQLKIPNNIITINRNIFSNCNGLIDLNFYDATNLATIGDSAFQECKNLTGDLTIPPNVTYIGDGAFENCNNLTNLDLTNVTSSLEISNNAFKNCFNLNALVVPNSITGIGINAFYGCSGLTNLDISNATKLKSIYSSAFEGCSGLKGILTFPESTSAIGSDSFIVWDRAFYGCSGLSGLDLTNAKKLTQIQFDAFSGCSGMINTLIIPSWIASIGDNAFFGNNYSNVYFSSLTPPNLSPHIFGKNNSSITINVPKGAKTAWDTTPNILTNLGIANLSQIVEPVTPPTSITINVNLNQTMKIGESLVINPTVTLNPIDANNDLNWSIIDSTSEAVIDPKTGKITYTPNTIGSKQLKLHVQSVLAPTVVANATINITVTEAPVISVTINETTATNFNIDLKSTSNNIISNYTATVNPTNAIQNVNWKLTGTNVPTWLKIDNNGRLYYDQIQDVNIANKSYNCNIVATSVGLNASGATVSSSPLAVTINVKQPSATDFEIINIDSKYDFYLGAEAKQINCAITTEPAYANKTATWSMSLVDTTDVPDILSINSNNGVITINKSTDLTQIGKYNVRITAILTASSLAKSVDTVINIIQPTASDIDIIADATGPYEVKLGTIDAKNVVKFTAKPASSEQFVDVNWTLQSTTGGPQVPTWVSIDSNGQLKVANVIDQTLIGKSIVFEIVATSKDNPAVSDWEKITINVVYADITDIAIVDSSLDQKYVLNINETKTIDCKAQLTPYADPRVEWSIKAKNADEIIPNTISIDPTTGKLTVLSNTLLTIEIVVTVRSIADNTKIAEKNVMIKFIDSPAPQPTNDFPAWAYLAIIGAVTLLVTALTVTIVTINRKK